MSALIDQLASESGLPDDSYAEVRRRAQSRLMSQGFPDLKTEAWKYTSLRVLEKREFQGIAQQPVPRCALPFEADVLAFDNGQYNPDASTLPDGVRLEPLNAQSLEALDYAGREDAFAWLNLARFEQAWKLSIDAPLARPLVLAFATSDDFSGAVHPRLHIELAANASASLVEWQHGQGEGLVNLVEQIHLRPNARLHHLVQRQHGELAWVQRTDVSIERDADYRFHALDGGGRLVRQDLTLDLLQAGAHGEIDGVALLDSRQHVDYHTAINHQVGHTTSRESFRMMADGTGVGVFNGRIYIARGADDSHSDLNTGNLLLSDSARINTKPELEIYAEDVTASHGATIGQLEDSALFYLRTRGIPTQEAMALLKFGFAAEPLENIENETLREWLVAELEKAL
ncbi:MAG: Fe-S cluster assembly protein SufD [Wenzhouxiangella sp.]